MIPVPLLIVVSSVYLAIDRPWLFLTATWPSGGLAWPLSGRHQDVSTRPPGVRAGPVAAGEA
ncbi:hypothetical protein ACWD7B_07595 [Streptomyces rubiginosohelvolus]